MVNSKSSLLFNTFQLLIQSGLQAISPWEHLGPKLGRPWLHPTWACLGNWNGPTETQHWDCSTQRIINVKNMCGIPMKLRGLTISYCASHVPHFEAKFGRSWSQVGPSWGLVGQSGRVGLKRWLWTKMCRSAKRANYHGENTLVGVGSILKMPTN